jgi:hypothetical protein
MMWLPGERRSNEGPSRLSRGMGVDGKVRATMNRFKISGQCMAMLTGLLAVCGGCVGMMDTATRPVTIHISSFEVPTDYESVCNRIMERARQRYIFTSDKAQRGNISMVKQPGEQTAVLRVQRRDQPVTDPDQYRVKAVVRGVDSSLCEVAIYCGTEDDLTEGEHWARWAKTPLENTEAPEWPSSRTITARFLDSARNDRGVRNARSRKRL